MVEGATLQQTPHTANTSQHPHSHVQVKQHTVSRSVEGRTGLCSVSSVEICEDMS